MSDASAADTPTTQHRRACLGHHLIVLGLLRLGQMVGLDVPWAALAPTAVVVIGPALMIGAWTGIHGGLIALGVVLTIGSVSASTTSASSFRTTCSCSSTARSGSGT